MKDKKQGKKFSSSLKQNKQSIANTDVQKEDRVKRTKIKKKKRIIIRNLSFEVDEKQLKEVFSKFGNVIDVSIPLSTDGKKKGFAFVEFEKTKSLIRGMKALNCKEIHGRKVAIDFAVDKTTYQSKLQGMKEAAKSMTTFKTKTEEEPKEDSEDDSDDASVDGKSETSEEDNCEVDEKEKKVNDFLKEFDFRMEDKENSKDGASDSSSEESDDEEEDVNVKEDLEADVKVKEESEEDEDFDSFSKHKGKRKPFDIDSPFPKRIKREKDRDDVSEGRTVFLRNVSFMTDQESLKKAVKQYGECEYCLLCIDPLSDHPKGTAFVKFKDKKHADALIAASLKDPGFEVDDRKLVCSYAISRDAVSHLHDHDKKPKDKRNLSLLKVGVIMSNSPESEGVSSADMAKRLQLEMVRKQKIRNVNFFVSNTRLAIHNLPKNFTDVKLRHLFKEAAGADAVITEARVMKEFKKTDIHGNPVSKGFGFVSFSQHEHALAALTKLNNNPKTFTPNKRPIVEFSVESRIALLSKERKIEKIRMRNKRRTEEKEARLAQNAKSKSLIDSEKLQKSKQNVMKSNKLLQNKKQEQDNKNKRNEIHHEKNSGESFQSKNDTELKKKKKKKNKVNITGNTIKQRNDSPTLNNETDVNKSKKKKYNKGKKKVQDTSNFRNMTELKNVYKTKLMSKSK